MEKLAVGRREAAALLSVSLRTIDAMLARGELRGRRVGRRVLVTMDDLRRFLKRDHNLPAEEGGK